MKFLETAGHIVNRKGGQRLLRAMGLVAMAPGPNTSQAHPDHKVYPYRLRGMAVVRPNHVWSTDITYIRLAHGFAYLVAIIDWYSRRVLGWRLSNTIDAAFCQLCQQCDEADLVADREFAPATDPHPPFHGADQIMGFAALHFSLQ